LFTSKNYYTIIPLFWTSSSNAFNYGDEQIDSYDSVISGAKVNIIFYVYLQLYWLWRLWYYYFFIYLQINWLWWECI